MKTGEGVKVFVPNSKLLDNPIPLLRQEESGVYAIGDYIKKF